MIDELLKKYPNDLKVVFKHNPLTSIHSNARPAAIAAAAAMQQGKFWEMHGVLYQNQRALDAPNLRKLAESIGLDMAAYDGAVAGPETAKIVDQEMAQALALGVRGTPTFFVDGVHAPSWNVATMSKLIDTAKSGGDVGLAAGEVMAEMAAARAKRPSQPAIDYNKVHEIDVGGSPFRGPADAPVTIVSFSDYQ